MLNIAHCFLFFCFLNASHIKLSYTFLGGDLVVDDPEYFSLAQSSLYIFLHISFITHYFCHHFMIALLLIHH